jgi:hypothetical protein
MLTSPRALLCLFIGSSALALAGCGRDASPVPVPDTPVAEAIVAADTDSQFEAEEGTSAGGEAHVHGAAEFAVAVDGDVLTVTLDAPLANFGLNEGDTDSLAVSTGIGDQLVSFEGDAGCKAGDRQVETRTSGHHSGLTLTLTFACTSVDKLEGVRLNAFTAFPDFETVNAVFIGPDAQVASVLTPHNPELAIR